MGIQVAGEEGCERKSFVQLIGRCGIAMSDMHMCGQVRIGKNVYEAESQFCVIRKGQWVEVVGVIFHHRMIVKPFGSPNYV